jgi:hypothetical protein
MAVLICEATEHVRNSDGRVFVARVYGEARRDGNWIGWIEFIPLTGVGKRRRTERETTQPSREALEYWASGLEPIYFEGAFARAAE